MSIFLALAMVLMTHADFNSKAIEHERLFQLDYHDHRSYLFAIDNEPRSSRIFEIIAARSTLHQVCEVMLRGQPGTSKRNTEATAPIVLADRLSLSAQAVLKKLDLGGLLDRRRKITTGDAWRLVRESWQAHLNAAAGRYISSLPAPDALVLSDVTQFDEYLHLAAPILYRKRHHSFSDFSLMKRANEWMALVFERAAVAPSLHFEEELVASAAAAGKEITPLEPYAPPPAVPDLEAVLDDMGSRLETSDEATYLNHLVADAMSQKLAEDYFEMSPDSYFTLREMLAESGLVSQSYFAGEESLRRHDANVHEFWVGRILSSLAKHPTFIALDPKWVLPMEDGDRRTSLLEALHARGVKITPVVRGGSPIRAVFTREPE